MIAMSTVHEIKALQAEGWSLSAIARHLSLDPKTVRKYWQQTDFSPSFPRVSTRASKLDPYKATIDQWLADDTQQWYKQRHTAQRVYDRLCEADPTCAVSYSTVRRYVQTRRQTVPTTGTLALHWHPGEAQVDFGHVDAYERGNLTRFHMLCMSFPYSNAAYVQLFRGETAECVVQGLTDCFHHSGGAPRRLVFDNATGVGRRVGETVRMTDLFERFAAHYGFTTTFCNPYAGYEKGHIENKVGYIRRNLFVPPPTVDDLCALNRELLDRSEQHWSRLHYKKGQPVVTLFAEDRAHWRALPADAFAAYRYTRVRATRQGMFHLDGPHWYSSAPEQANQLLVVRIGAHTVTPMTLAGQPITTHARVYGSLRSDSTDYRTTVHQLSQKPGAWRNSLLREALPETVRTALDEALRTDLKTALEALAHCTDRWGFDHAVRALGMAVEQQRMSYGDIVMLATHAGLMPETAMPGPDLTAYDDLFPAPARRPS